MVQKAQVTEAGDAEGAGLTLEAERPQATAFDDAFVASSASSASFEHAITERRRQHPELDQGSS